MMNYVYVYMYSAHVVSYIYIYTRICRHMRPPPLICVGVVRVCGMLPAAVRCPFCPLCASL